MRRPRNLRPLAHYLTGPTERGREEPSEPGTKRVPRELQDFLRCGSGGCHSWPTNWARKGASQPRRVMQGEARIVRLDLAASAEAAARKRGTPLRRAVGSLPRSLLSASPAHGLLFWLRFYLIGRGGDAFVRKTAS